MKETKSINSSTGGATGEIEQIITDLAKAWTYADPELIVKHLGEEFVYDSQWVFESLDKTGYVNYIRGKMATIKNNHTMPEVEIVDDPYSHSLSAGGKMLQLNQAGNVSYYRIKIKNGKVVKGDMCMF